MNLFLITALLVVAVKAAYVPTKLSYQSFAVFDETAQGDMKEALTSVGLLSLTDVPGLRDIRSKILSHASNCVLAFRHQKGKLHSTFDDGTERFTLAAETVNSFKDVFHGADLDSDFCQEFKKSEQAFKLIVDEALDKFVTNLDRVLGTDVAPRVLLQDDSDSTRDVASFQALIQRGTQLEHFHTYEKVSTSLKHEYSLEMHKDMGLFIVLLPALTLSAQNHATGNGEFFIQLENGAVVAPDFGDGDELVFMIGEGFEQWINPNLDTKLRATPHAMTMPKATNGVSLRSWYGKMVLPPPTAYLTPQRMTFRGLLETFESPSSVQTVCSPGGTLSHRNLQQCAEGKFYCWTICFDLAECASNEEPHCFRELENGEYFDCGTEIHGGGCDLVCLEKEDDSLENVTTNIGNTFCNGIAVSMYMEGFQTVGISSNECVVFLFESWVLDSPGKYFGASLFTISVGVFIELVVSFRRRVERWDAGNCKVGAKLGLYFTQVLFGYIAMLIAMTYSVVLFLLVVVGLTTGHYLFNFNVKAPKEHADPCCVEPVEVAQEGKIQKHTL